MVWGTVTKLEGRFNREARLGDCDSFARGSTDGSAQSS
jgi:hypothetical protein